MPDVFEALAQIATGRKADPLAPVTVIAPSHLAAIHLRRRLAEIASFAAVRFETAPRLAELIGAGHLAAKGRSPLARPIGDYVAEEVARESEGVLAGVRDLPGYGRVLRQLFRRLRRGGVRNAGEVPPELLSGHLREVVRLYGRFRDRTSAFYDEEDLLDAATDAILAGRAGALADLGSIYVLPPGALTAASARFFDTLRSAVPSYIELTDPPPAAEERFVLAPDPATEAREAVREALRALEGGVPLHEIAVLHGADETYGQLLREAFELAAVPAVSLPGLSLAKTPAGRGVLALALLTERDFARGTVMDFLAVAPLRDRLPSKDGPIHAMTAAWDRVSRDAGVTRGAGRWSRALSALIADCDADLAKPWAGNDAERRQRALEYQRDQAARLRDVVEALVEAMQAIAHPMPAGKFIEAFLSIVDSYLDSQAEGLDRARQEIERLGTIDAVSGTFDIGTFERMLRANLEAVSLRERKVGEGVVIADHRSAPGLRFRRVILCGAYEGSFPAGPGPEPLVEDRAWSRLREAFPYVEDAPLRVERAIEAARRAIATASETLVWTSPVYQPGGAREYYPSHLMVEAAARRDPSIRTASDLRSSARASDWLRRGSSPLATMLTGPTVDHAEFGLRDAIRLRASRRQAPRDHPRARAVAMLRARRSDRFTEWDGNLMALADDQWLDLQGSVSPTSLENYGDCGFRYLCRSLWKLNVVDEPEERELIEPKARGTLIHSVLDRFFREQQARGRPAPGEPWNGDDRRRLLEITDEAIDDAARRGLTGLDVYANHETRAIRADLEAFLEADTAFRRETGAVPFAFEHAMTGVEIAGVAFRGYIDRIDRTPDGAVAWVIDYKSGGTFGYPDPDGDDPFGGGAKLQLPVYVRAVEDAAETRAMYWFITRKGGFARRLYVPTPEREERFEQTVQAITAGIRAGAFPAVPGNEDGPTFKNCKFCDFDRVCPRRRADNLEAKEGDPRLGPWFAVGRVAREETEP